MPLNQSHKSTFFNVKSEAEKEQFRPKKPGSADFTPDHFPVFDIPFKDIPDLHRPDA